MILFSLRLFLIFLRFFHVFFGVSDAIIAGWLKLITSCYLAACVLCVQGPWSNVSTNRHYMLIAYSRTPAPMFYCYYESMYEYVARNRTFYCTAYNCCPFIFPAKLGDKIMFSAFLLVTKYYGHLFCELSH